MPQAIHFESSASIPGLTLWQRMQLLLNAAKGALSQYSDQLLNYAIESLSRRPNNRSPLRYSRVNRHTWQRYSALLVARDEMDVSLNESVSIKSEAVAISTVSPTHKNQCNYVSVKRVLVEPIWASASHDWHVFEVDNG